MLLAFTGAAFVCVWSVGRMNDAVQEFLGTRGEPGRYEWMGKIGAVWFTAAWVWSALTGYIIWRESVRLENPS